METEPNPEETLALGGNISLSGFRDLEPGSMTIIKKVVGTFAKKISEKHADFEKLAVAMKKVHAQENSEKYEVHARLHIKGQSFFAEDTDKNIFFVLDKVLKRVEEQVIHHMPQQ